MDKLLSHIATIARSRRALAASAAGLLLLFVAEVARPLRHLSAGSDAQIVFDHASAILTSGHYPARLDAGNFSAIFPYPPPAAIIFGGLTTIGFTGFMTVWIALMAIGLVCAFRFAVTHEDPSTRRAFLSLALPAIAIASRPAIYDLSNLNNNLILLGMTMAAFSLMNRRPLLGGALLALPITMKLYVGALLLWLVVYRPRAAIPCVAVLAALWVAMPVVIFGFQPTIDLYGDWRDQLTIASGVWVYHFSPGIGPPLITLRRAVAFVIGAEPFASATQVTLYVLEAAWVALLAAYAWRAFRVGTFQIRSRAALADWTVLLLAPLPFSPWLELYHAVPVLMAVTLCLIVLFDQQARPVSRIASAVALGVVAMSELPQIPFAARGLAYLFQFAALTLALVAIRPALLRTQDWQDAAMPTASGSLRNTI